jgi:hypothetical protein
MVIVVEERYRIISFYIIQHTFYRGSAGIFDHLVKCYTHLCPLIHLSVSNAREQIPLASLTTLTTRSPKVVAS